MPSASLPHAAEDERAALAATVDRLHRRGSAGSTLVTHALLLSATGMAVARYL